MRILYGVVGEGMGHASRSLVVLLHLLGKGHEVRVLASGRACSFLSDRLAEFARARVEQIQGLRFAYRENRLDIPRTLGVNLRSGPRGFAEARRTFESLRKEGFRAELVISDFESLAALYAWRHAVPLICLDNQHVLTHCRHSLRPPNTSRLDAWIARRVIDLKVPRAYHYLVTSFYYPPVSKPRTTLVPPILRDEILTARREPGDHVLVYERATSAEELVAILRELPYEFRVYGFEGENEAGNVTFRPFSAEGFIEDLRTARALVDGGGFSLMSEAIHLGVPPLSIPIGGQYEQQLNALWLARLGYGAQASTLDPETVGGFLERSDELARNLESYPREDNGMLLACLEELLERRARGEPPPARLASPAMGKWEEGGGE